MEEEQKAQSRPRGRPFKDTGRRVKLYDNGNVYLGPRAKDMGFSGELVPIFTPQAVLLVRPGATAQQLGRCIELAMKRMLQEEGRPLEQGMSAAQVASVVRDRLGLVLMELEVVRGAASVEP